MRLIYSTNNDSGTRATYVRGSLILGNSEDGTCAAQAVLVLKNFRVGMKVNLTRPDPAQALILQARCNMGVRNTVDSARKMISISGLRLASEPGPYPNLRELLQYTGSNDGLYMLGMNSHLMAIINKASGLFFFDANDGLFECERGNVAVFIDNIVKHIIYSQYKPATYKSTGAEFFVLISVR